MPPNSHSAVSRHPAYTATKDPMCSNLPAKWNRGQALAESGRTAQAYGLYLELLRVCTNPGELSGTAWKAAKGLPPADVDRLIADPVFEQPSLKPVRNELRLQRMYAENEAGHDANALAYSRALRADPSVKLNASALEVSGWLEDRAHDDRAAEALFREALKTARDPSSARLGLTLSLMHQQRLVEAEAESRNLATPQGKRLHAAIELALAKDSHDSAQVDAALRLVEEAGDATEPATRALAGWALLNSGRPAQAEQIFSKLHEAVPGNDEYIHGLVFAAAANRDYETLDTLVNENPNIPPVARQTLADHDERLGLYDRARALTGHPSEGQEPSLQSLFTLDRKSGTAGQDKLTVWTIPQLSITMLASPSLTVRIDGTALRLDDGVQHAWGKLLGTTVRTEVGQGVLFAGAALEKPGEGPVQVLGKVQYQRMAESEDEFLRVTLSRDSIYDSLRAFEGAPSAGTGPAISSSLEVAARQAIGRSAFHFGETLSGGAVTASGTAVNPFYAISLSLTRDFRAKGWSWLNAGPEIRLSSYRYDANRFDGPYGGYWSPKSNREAGLVFYAQSDEGSRFLFKTGGRFGYATRELFTGHASGAFGEDTTTIAGLLARHLIVGTGIGYRASPGYHDMSVFAWLKIPFEPRGHLRAADLVTPRGF
ncbi:tetratricopeptide repeat protein [Paraburkholderia mimosarum]|uniref:hypothetical protein n=1 Tax=Paraburkholderia mimosarum TaxID=312026 RepID=UPI0012B57E7C|nr:hypothetical protein [Paraburkholderia mimosarum]